MLTALKHFGDKPMMRFCLLMLTLILMSSTPSADEVPADIQQMVKHIYGNMQPDSVRKSEISGLYEIISNGNVVYLDPQRDILLAGKIIRISDYRDFTEQSLSAYRRQLMQDFDESKMITYSPKNYQHTVYVFTDVDCHYCRLFHQNIKEINRLGIRVNYLFAPYRGDEAYARAEGVWCSKRRQDALDRAKLGKDIPLRQCDTPVAEHLKLAQKFGVSGTPGILLSDGTLLRGLREPQQLLAAIQQIGK